MSVEGRSVGGSLAGAASVVVNEGPFRGSLEGFRPMNTSDINTIDFKGGTVAPSRPLVIQQAEEVAAAAWEKSELPTPQEAVSQAEIIIAQNQKPVLDQQKAVIVPNVIPVWMPDHLTQPQVAPQIAPWVEPRVWPVVLPWVEPTPELQVSPALEPVAKTRVSHQISRAVLPQPLLQEQQEVEEVVLESVKVDEPKESLEEEEEIEKKLFLEDEKALAVRKFEIKQAVKLAFASVKDAKLSTVLGSLVAAFLPGEHAGNRSQALAEKGPDGSYEETVEAIASSGELSSPEQAEKRFEEIVDEKKPIKDGINGNPVANSVVARVFKFKAVKPPAAVEIYTKRVVKKQAQVPVGQAVAPKTETNEIPLEELSQELAEVFEKAA